MRRCLLVSLAISSALLAQTPDWVARSNRNTQILIDLDAKYAPESAAEEGVTGLDDQIAVLSADRHDKIHAALAAAARTELQSRLANENDPLVRQDLEIPIQSADRDIRSNDATYNAFLAHQGFTQIQAERKPIASRIAAARKLPSCLLACARCDVALAW